MDIYHQQLITIHQKVNEIEQEITNATQTIGGRIVAKIRGGSHPDRLIREFEKVKKIVDSQPKEIVDIHASADRLLRIDIDLLLGKIKDVSQQININKMKFSDKKLERIIKFNGELQEYIVENKKAIKRDEGFFDEVRKKYQTPARESKSISKQTVQPSATSQPVITPASRSSVSSQPAPAASPRTSSTSSSRSSVQSPLSSKEPESSFHLPEASPTPPLPPMDTVKPITLVRSSAAPVPSSNEKPLFSQGTKEPIEREIDTSRQKEARRKVVDKKRKGKVKEMKEPEESSSSSEILPNDEPLSPEARPLKIITSGKSHKTRARSNSAGKAAIFVEPPSRGKKASAPIKQSKNTGQYTKKRPKPINTSMEKQTLSYRRAAARVRKEESSSPVKEKILLSIILQIPLQERKTTFIQQKAMRDRRNRLIHHVLELRNPMKTLRNNFFGVLRLA